MKLRYAKIILVAACTFVVGSPLLFGIAWRNRGRVPQEVHGDMQGSAAMWAAQVGDVVDPGGRWVARGMRAGDGSDRVNNTEVFRAEGGALVPVRVIPYSAPIAWSPLHSGVLLLCQNSEDCEDQNLILDVADLRAAPVKFGCRYCTFESWSPRDDSVRVTCMNGHQRIEHASTAPVIAATSGEGGGSR